jgi:hypothetical protein
VLRQFDRIGSRPLHQFELPPRSAAQVHGPVAPGVDHRVRRQPAGKTRKAGHGAAVEGGMVMRLDFVM